MRGYLGSSIVLRWLLKQTGAYRDWSRWDGFSANVLLKVETNRALDRLRLSGILNDATRAALMRQFQEFSTAVEWVPLQDEILQRAGQPFPTAIRTLDAIHLASALIFCGADRIPFLTHDHEQGLAAQALGFPVEGI